MRASSTTAGVFVVAAAVAACGGASPPAQTAPGESRAPTAAPVEAAPTLPESAPSSELMAGIKAFDAGSYAEARKSFEAAAKKNPNDFQALYNLGMACEKLGDKPAAEAAYRAALAAKPDLEAAAAELCALYVDEGRIDDALATGRAALTKHPGNSALHENVGVALAMRGDQENATHELEEAIKAQPSEPMFHLTLAHWLNVWHVAGGAAPHLDAARDLVKDDYGMIASVGHEYRMGGAFDSCIKTFDRAIQMKDGGEVRTERALCRLGLKDEKGMLDDLQAAVAREPGYSVAHYYLGGRLEHMKRFKEAAVEFAKYLELSPSGSLSKPASERLKAAQEAAKAGGAGQKKK
jgi:tetratricopeptide (TPR) repeat protein